MPAPSTDKRVTVTLSLQVSDQNGDMTGTSHTMRDMPYVGAVFIQKRMLELLNELHGWGVSLAKGETADIKV